MEIPYATIKKFNKNKYIIKKIKKYVCIATVGLPKNVR